MSLEGEEEGKIYIWSVIILQWRKLSAFVKKTCSRMEDNTLAYLQNNGSNNNNV